MTEITNVSTEVGETLTNRENLLDDPEVVTTIFRRHSIKSSKQMGALAPVFQDEQRIGEGGPALATKEAENVVGSLKNLIHPVEVHVIASPSWMPNFKHIRGPINQPEIGQPLPAELKSKLLTAQQEGRLPEELEGLSPEDFDRLSAEQIRLLFPIDPARLNAEQIIPGVISGERAFYTAREYAKVLHQKGLLKDEPKNHVEPNGAIMMEGVDKDKRLGDLFEFGNEKIPGFHKLLAGTRYKYIGGPSFWADFMNRTLDTEVAEAYRAAGGDDSVDIAERVLGLLTERSSLMQNDKLTEQTKEVGIALTHGEVLESFVHHLAGFVGQSGTKEGQEFVRKLHEGPDALYSQTQQRLEFHENTGFAVHLRPNHGDIATGLLTVELKPDQQITVGVQEFKKYLDSLKVA